jgi:hypothetical protein
MTAQDPSAGRIVRYVLPETHHRVGEVRPAIVIRAWNGLDDPSNPGMSNLQIFLDGPNDLASGGIGGPTEWVGSVLYSEEPKPGTWHWPPRG